MAVVSQHGMMAGRAAPTGLPERDQRVRAITSAAHGRSGQSRGDPGITPPDHGPGTPLGKARLRFSSGDRAFLAALLHRLPAETLRRFRLLIRPDTVLRWHRNLLAHRHAARPRPQTSRPPTDRTLDPTPGTAPGTRESCLRLPPHPRRTPSCSASKVAASTVWQIHRAHQSPDQDPQRHRAPDRLLDHPSRQEPRHGPQPKAAPHASRSTTGTGSSQPCSTPSLPTQASRSSSAASGSRE